jgi:hypothetical protein
MIEIEKNDKNSISNIFTNELFNPTMNLSIDYSEIFIDELLDNDAIKSIPIVKSIIGFIKTGFSINQLFFTKKILTFIKEFNSGDIQKEKHIAFQTKLNNNIKFRNQAIEQIMIFNDRFIQLQQSMICAQLFKNYVNETISYNDFLNLNIFLERLHPKVYKFMQSIEKFDFNIDEDFQDERNWDTEALLLSSGLGTEPSDWWSGFKLTQDGINLYKYGIKPLL